jgi:hypothetical protein
MSVAIQWHGHLALIESSSLSLPRRLRHRRRYVGLTRLPLSKGSEIAGIWEANDSRSDYTDSRFQ